MYQKRYKLWSNEYFEEKKHGYKTINSIFHKHPEPTQIKGRCIDQAWIRLVSNKLSLIDHLIKTCVYSDHENVKIELKMH